MPGHVFQRNLSVCPEGLCVTGLTEGLFVETDVQPWGMDRYKWERHTLGKEFLRPYLKNTQHTKNG
jgi:hypothetical protein